jgi:acyl-CoA synthetase (NDP forming)
VFGLGGVRTELYRDVSLRLAPIDEAEAARMIREVKAWPLLDGFRGAPKADVDALARIVAAVSRFAAAHADVVESLDINPLIVHDEGRGATAVDAVLVLRPGEPAPIPHLEIRRE